MKADCWSKGEGKEGQGPHNKGKSLQANSAQVTDADDIWMAEVLSDNEWEERIVENLSGYVNPTEEEWEEGIFSGLGAMLTQDELYSLWKIERSTDTPAETLSDDSESYHSISRPSNNLENDLDNLPNLQGMSEPSELSDEQSKVTNNTPDDWFSDCDQTKILICRRCQTQMMTKKKIQDALTGHQQVPCESTESAHWGNTYQLQISTLLMCCNRSIT